MMIEQNISVIASCKLLIFNNSCNIKTITVEKALMIPPLTLLYPKIDKYYIKIK